MPTRGTFTRTLLILLLATAAATAQKPTVRLTNATHPGNPNFVFGDHFELTITGAPDQPVSVKTTFNGQTDWGPIIGRTDRAGEWSITGHFNPADFGDWDEAWTVGSRLNDPIHFAVRPPCLPNGRDFVSQMSLAHAETCDIASGTQTFTAPSPSGPNRRATPDGFRAVLD